MMRYIVGFLVTVLLMLGCARKVEMTSDVKERLTSLSIADEVTMPSEFSVHTRRDVAVDEMGALGAVFLLPTKAGASLFGKEFFVKLLLASSISFINRLDKSDENRFMHLMQEHHIDFGKMLKKAYLKALQKKPYYAQKLVTTSADATFKISVPTYGLLVGFNVFKDSYRLGSKVQIELVDKNGEVLWRENEVVNMPFHKDIESLIKPYDDYAKHPEILRKDLEYLATYMAETIVSRLP